MTNKIYLRYLEKLRMKITIVFFLYTLSLSILCTVYKEYMAAIPMLLSSLLFLGKAIRTKVSKKSQLVQVVYQIRGIYIMILILTLIYPTQMNLPVFLLVAAFASILYTTVFLSIGIDTMHWGYSLYFCYGLVGYLIVMAIRSFTGNIIYINPILSARIGISNIICGAVSILSSIFDLRLVSLMNKSVSDQQILLDELTKVYNRKILKKIPDRKFHAVFFDIDFFKQINDKYGHDNGDIVLQTFANHVLSQLRYSDDIIFFRQGGEEFILLVKDSVRPSELDNMVIRLMNSIRNLRIELSSDIVNITVSCGIKYSEDLSVEDTINLADKQMYLAKISGRDCIYRDDVNIEEK